MKSDRGLTPIDTDERRFLRNKRRTTMSEMLILVGTRSIRRAGWMAARCSAARWPDRRDRNAGPVCECRQFVTERVTYRCGGLRGGAGADRYPRPSARAGPDPQGDHRDGHGRGCRRRIHDCGGDAEYDASERLSGEPGVDAEPGAWRSCAAAGDAGGDLRQHGSGDYKFRGAGTRGRGGIYRRRQAGAGGPRDARRPDCGWAHGRAGVAACGGHAPDWRMQHECRASGVPAGVARNAGRGGVAHRGAGHPSAARDRASGGSAAASACAACVDCKARWMRFAPRRRKDCM